MARRETPSYPPGQTLLYWLGVVARREREAAEVSMVEIAALLGMNTTLSAGPLGSLVVIGVIAFLASGLTAVVVPVFSLIGKIIFVLMVLALSQAVWHGWMAHRDDVAAARRERARRASQPSR